VKKFKALIRVTMTIVGIGVGPGLYFFVAAIFAKAGFKNYTTLLTEWANLIIMLVLAIIFGFIFYLLSPSLANWLQIKEKQLKKIPTVDMISGIAGLIIGLIIAYLMTRLLQMLPEQMDWFVALISVLSYIVLAYLGISIGVNKRDEIKSMIFVKKRHDPESLKQEGSLKLLDTSAIIDGRIYDIALTGFLEGTIGVPDFVLTELRHIADSEDDLKRGRGRRGLDILNKMQGLTQVKVEVIHQDIPKITEVDAKLIGLAQKLDACVVTNDYNLNKVAGVQGVNVLNVNELANAVKPVALPGERMFVKIVKEGKEQMQGVAFLPDGTMIVVQDARDKIGLELDVEVTSSLQTSAGRMIFARTI
jgi:uncharacterized protein YacL